MKEAFDELEQLLEAIAGQCDWALQNEWSKEKMREMFLRIKSLALRATEEARDLSIEVG